MTEPRRLASVWVGLPVRGFGPAGAPAAARAGDVALFPGALLETLRPQGYPWLLESALRPHPLARFSFVGADPWAVVRGFVRHRRAWAELVCRRRVRPDVAPGAWRVPGDPLAAAEALVPPPPGTGSEPGGALEARRENAAPELPFVGGAVGYLGYELAAAFETATPAPAFSSDLPDLVLLLVDRLVAVDHHSGCVFAVGLGVARDPEEAHRRARHAAGSMAQHAAASMARHAAKSMGRHAPESAAGSGPGDFPACSAAPTAFVPKGASISAPAAASAAAPTSASTSPAAAAPTALGPRLDPRDYRAAVEAILPRIAAGDLYQACLTRGLEVPFAGDPWALYAALRRRNPAPFAAYLELPEAAVVGSSPERFLRVDARGGVESRPIKGTRPRGADPRTDAGLRDALAASAKDRAENLMIVDLVRNDLGRVCRAGSVEVPALFRIESYASVHQMVSVVRGRLAPGRRAGDAVRAAFPPGSMTGAPKLAAMALLARLEGRPRGVYAGALGYLDVRGGADLAVVIRTLVVAAGRARLHTGGGVVADSDPGAEHAEALDKAAALLEALAEAGAEVRPAPRVDGPAAPPAAQPPPPAPASRSAPAADSTPALPSAPASPSASASPASVFAPGGSSFTPPSAGPLDDGPDRPIPSGS